jgi:hypothetical protein
MLDASASRDDGQIVKYEWFEGEQKLGEGKKLEAKLGVGEHTVKLVVTDDKGAKSESELKVKVLARPESVIDLLELYEQISKLNKVKVKYDKSISLNPYLNWLIKLAGELVPKEELKNMNVYFAYGNLKARLTYYKYEDVEKLTSTYTKIREGEEPTQVEITLKKKGKQIVCSKHVIWGRVFECTLNTATEVPLYAEDLKGFMVVGKSGERSIIAGRECSVFNIEKAAGTYLFDKYEWAWGVSRGFDLSEDTEAKFMDEIKKRTKWVSTVCIEEDTGVVLGYEINLVDIKSKEKLITYKVYATNVSEKVGYEEMGLPVSFFTMSKAVCMPSRVTLYITSFKEELTGMASLKITENDNTTHVIGFELPKIEFGETRKVAVDISKEKVKDFGVGTLTICYEEGECIATQCE